MLKPLGLTNRWPQLTSEQVRLGSRILFDSFFIPVDASPQRPGTATTSDLVIHSLEESWFCGKHHGSVGPSNPLIFERRSVPSLQECLLFGRRGLNGGRAGSEHRSLPDTQERRSDSHVNRKRTPLDSSTRQLPFELASYIQGLSHYL